MKTLKLTPPTQTYTIIGINIIAWLLLQGAGFGQDLPSSVCEYGLIPADLFNDALTQVNNSRCEKRSRLAGYYKLYIYARQLDAYFR